MLLCILFILKILNNSCVFSGDREPCMYGSITKERANTLVPVIARFLTSCAAEQIRLASEKCTELFKVFVS